MLRISVLANLTSLIGLAVVSQPSYAIILGGYTFDSSTAVPSSVAPNITFSNFSASGVTGPTYPNGNPNTGKAYSASNWELTASYDANQYFSFTVTPDNNSTFHLASLTFDAHRSTTGPAKIQVRSNFDNYSNLIGSEISTATSFPAQPINVDLSSFINISAPLEFRIYGYNATATGGTLRVDNVQLSGDPVGVPFESNAFPVLVTMAFFGGGMIIKNKLAKKVVILDKKG